MNSQDENTNGNNEFDESNGGIDGSEPEDRTDGADFDETSQDETVSDEATRDEASRDEAAYDHITGDGGPSDFADGGPQSYESRDEDLPRLLKRVSRLVRPEFLAAASDGGFDPRDFGRMRRGRRWADDRDEVADGGPGPGEPVTFGRRRGPEDARAPWERGGAELREQIQKLRDEASSRVEEVLSSEEFDRLKVTLSKIADSFGHDNDSDPWNEDEQGHRGREVSREHEPERNDEHAHERKHERGCEREHAHRDYRDQHRGHDRGNPRGAGRDGRRRGRGFGPNVGPGQNGFGPGAPGGPGFGPGFRGFGPFGWFADQCGHREEAAFERGFAAGFEQGSRS